MLKLLRRRAMSKVLLYSVLLRDINHCKILRFLSIFPITYFLTKIIQTVLKLNKKYSRCRGKVFIKGYYAFNHTLGLKGSELKLMKYIILFIYVAKAN